MTPNTVKQHFLEFSTYTFPGAYLEYLQKILPSDVREFGPLIRQNIIHRVTLLNGNTFSNSDLRYGDMTKVPWWQQPQDDILPTTGAMLSELMRRDSNGFTLSRKEADRLILTCRFIAILTASIFKAKGIPARVRSGFEPYAVFEPGTSCDHWVTEYWSESQSRWILVDVDCCLESFDFDPFDIPNGKFEFSPNCWLGVRSGAVDANRYLNAGGFKGLLPLAWELLYDFHCLMNDEIIYLHSPGHLRIEEFEKMSNADLTELDNLAVLMTEVDRNFVALKDIWSTNRRLRLLKGALL